MRHKGRTREKLLKEWQLIVKGRAGGRPKTPEDVYGAIADGDDLWAPLDVLRMAFGPLVDEMLRDDLLQVWALPTPQVTFTTRAIAAGGFEGASRTVTRTSVDPATGRRYVDEDTGKAAEYEEYHEADYWCIRPYAEDEVRDVMVDGMPLEPETSRPPARRGVYEMPFPDLRPDPKSLPKPEEGTRRTRRQKRREEQKRRKAG